MAARQIRVISRNKGFRVSFKKNGKLLPQFLDEAMRLPSVREQIEAKLTGTSPTMKNISKPALDLCFPLPESDVQRDLIEELTTARQSAEAIRAEAQTLRSAAWTAFYSTLFEAKA